MGLDLEPSGTKVSTKPGALEYVDKAVDTGDGVVIKKEPITSDQVDTVMEGAGRGPTTKAPITLPPAETRFGDAATAIDYWKNELHRAQPKPPDLGKVT